MGLEKYGKVLFDGAAQIEDLSSMEVAGVERYVTGLDEFSPAVKGLPAEERAAKTKQIRETVAKLELELAQNVLDIEDPDFWKKATLLNPTNRDFWSKLNLTVESDAKPLDPTDPHDLLRIHAIEAGGFTLVAPSLEAARKSNKRYKFYLSRLEDTSAVRTELKKLRNKAGGELDKLREAKQNKLFLVSKVYLASENGFTRSTPLDVLYDKIDDKINGVGQVKDKKAAVDDFLKICKMENKSLLLTAYVRDAIFYRILIMKSNKHYFTPSGSMAGKTLAEIVEFYANPINETELQDLIDKVENRWR
jgi:hypothetical protein